LVLVAEGLDSRPLIRVAATRPLRVLVVDDQEVVRNGLRWLLNRVDWVEQCVAVASVPETQGFDVTLVGVGLAGACGQLTGRVGLLSGRWDHVSMRAARALGASGVIDTDLPARELLRAVHALAAGREVEPAPVAPGEIRFIPREREILRLVEAGLTNAEIGAAMFLAPGTIKHHMLEIFEKLGAPNRAGAVHAARRLSVLTDPAPLMADPNRSVRVLVIDPRDVHRTGTLLALQRLPWVEACAGARTAAVSRHEDNPVGVTVDRVREAGTDLTASDLLIDVSSSWEPGDEVEVSASYPYQIKVLGVTIKKGRMHSTTTERVE